MKNVIKKAFVLLLVLSFALIPSFVFADDEIIKDYTFTSESRDDLSYDAPQSITEDGKEYELKSISYEVVSENMPYSVIKDVEVSSLDDFKDEITEIVDGKEVVLKADAPNWEKEEVEREHIVRNEARIYASRDAVLPSVTVDGLVYYLVNTTERTTPKPFTAPAYFAATEKETTMYIFDGKAVEITGSNPVWNGWQDDVMDYLKISAPQFQVDSIAWNGDFTGEEGSYIREAVVSGRQLSSDFYAVYTYDSERDMTEEDKEYTYTATITYTEEKDVSYNAVAHAVYIPKAEEKKGLSTGQIIGIGAGAAVLAGAGAGLFFFLGKKRKDNKE